MGELDGAHKGAAPFVDLRKAKLQLDDVVRILEQICCHSGLKAIKGKDVVICLGKPCSGKSTVLTSLATGPDSLKPCTVVQKDSLAKRKSITFKKKEEEDK